MLLACILAILFSAARASPLLDADSANFLNSTSLSNVEPICTPQYRKRPILVRQHCKDAGRDLARYLPGAQYTFTRDTRKVGRPGYIILPIKFLDYECKVEVDVPKGWEHNVKVEELIKAAAKLINSCVEVVSVVNGGLVLVPSLTPGYDITVTVSDALSAACEANSTVSLAQPEESAGLRQAADFAPVNKRHGLATWDGAVRDGRR